MKSHTGIAMAIGKGTLSAAPKKQKLAAKSSREAELAAAGGGPSQALRARRFLEAQGCTLGSATLCQGNQSAIFIEQNGKAPSAKRARHISIRHFCIAGATNEQKLAGAQHLLADLAQGGYYTKPLSGGQFHRMRNLILSIDGNGRQIYKKAYEAYSNKKESASAEHSPAA